MPTMQSSGGQAELSARQNSMLTQGVALTTTAIAQHIESKYVEGLALGAG